MHLRLSRPCTPKVKSDERSVQAAAGSMGKDPEGRKGRKMSSWGGYSGSWSGSWGSSSVNVNPGGGSSGSWNTPYSSGTWGSGGSSSNTNTQNTNTDKQAEAPAPNTVYYNGNGVLVQKLADGTTQTVVKNEYTDVNVNSGRRRY